MSGYIFDGWLRFLHTLRTVALICVLGMFGVFSVACLVGALTFELDPVTVISWFVFVLALIFALLLVFALLVFLIWFLFAHIWLLPVFVIAILMLVFDIGMLMRAIPEPLVDIGELLKPYFDFLSHP